MAIKYVSSLSTAFTAKKKKPHICSNKYFVQCM